MIKVRNEPLADAGLVPVITIDRVEDAGPLAAALMEVAISEAGPGSFDWAAVFQGADWFHVSGITAALSQSAADLCFEAVRSAKRRGATVSCDYNFRAKLWKYGKQAPEVMRELVRLVDVGIANEEDCHRSLGIALQEEPAA